MDVSISNDDQKLENSFRNKMEQLKSDNANVMACEHCFIIFTDPILHSFHVAMHTPFDIWKCSMCQNQFSNRHDFQNHIGTISHSLIPPGVVIPDGIQFVSGLPDLSLMCESSDVLNEALKKVENTEKDK